MYDCVSDNVCCLRIRERTQMEKRLVHYKMKQRLLLSALIICIFSMLLPIYAQETYETETESTSDLLTILSRSELEGLGEIDGPIYVFGHQTPDSDAVCTAIGYAYILKELGYDARPAVLGDINKETAYILKTAGVDVPPVLEDASGKNVVLVDHSEYSQSAEGLKDANVLMIIDHHGDGSVITGNQLIYDARPMGSAATIAWIRSMNYGVELDQKISMILLGAILSDTNNLKYSATTADREAVRCLAEKAGITDVDAFDREMYKASISYEGMTDKEILLSDMKKYEKDDKAFVIGVVQCFDEKEAVKMAGRMKAVMPGVISSEGVDFGYAQVCVFHDDIDINYIVPSDEVAEELLKKAFEGEGKWEGEAFVLDPGVSRRKVLVPRLIEALSLHPTE